MAAPWHWHPWDPWGFKKFKLPSFSNFQINEPGQDDSKNEQADALDTVPLVAVCPECFHPVDESLETPGPWLRHVLTEWENDWDLLEVSENFADLIFSRKMAVKVWLYHSDSDSKFNFRKSSLVWIKTTMFGWKVYKLKCFRRKSFLSWLSPFHTEFMTKSLEW